MIKIGHGLTGIFWPRGLWDGGNLGVDPCLRRTGAGWVPVCAGIRGKVVKLCQKVAKCCKTFEKDGKKLHKKVQDAGRKAEFRALGASPECFG